MLKKILVMPLGVLVLLFTLWALELAFPEELPLPLLICFALILLFPLPLLPAATLLPHGKFRTLIHRLGEAVIGAYLYFLILLVIDAVICTIAHFTGAFSLSLPILAGCTLVAWLLILLAGALNARRIKTVHHKITISEKQGAMVRAVLISDLHLGFFSTGAFIDRMVKAINNAHAEYLFVAGDLFDSDLSELNEKKNAPQLLSQIQAPKGAYLCMGNHDLYAANCAGFEDFIRRAGLWMLHDERISLPHFDLIGRSDVREKERLSLDTLLNKDSEKPQIVLCHNPKDGEKLIKAGADLVLCGHTHNGQTFPGNIVSKIKSRYSYGLNPFQKGFVLTTAGAGYWGPPLRVFTSNEIVILDLYF